MKKKILIGLGALVALVVVWFLWRRARTSSQIAAGQQSSLSANVTLGSNILQFTKGLSSSAIPLVAASPVAVGPQIEARSGRSHF